MQRIGLAARAAVISAVLLLPLWAAGCGASYPYFNYKGSVESRVVVIHLDENKTEEVPVGTGLGAGLTSGDMELLYNGQPVVKEKGAARVTMSAEGGPVVVKKVEYDSQEVFYHQPAL